MADSLPCSLECTNEEIGELIIRSLSQSPHLARVAEDADALWDRFILATGHSSWNELFKNAEYVSIYGRQGSYLEIAGSRRENGSYLHFSPTRVMWNLDFIGDAFRAAAHSSQQASDHV